MILQEFSQTSNFSQTTMKPKKRLNCPLYAIVFLIFFFVFVRLILNWIFYFCQGPIEQFYTSTPKKTNKTNKTNKQTNRHVYFAFQFPGRAPASGTQLMLQGQWGKDDCLNSNHVTVSGCTGASCSVQQPDFRRLFEEVMQSICWVSK